MKYDICIHTGADKKSILFFIKIKENLAKQKISLQLFTLNQEIETFVPLEHLKDFVVLPRITEKYNIDNSIQFVKQLGINNFSSLYRTQQIFHDLAEKQIIKLTAQKIESVKSILNTTKSKYYITFAGDEIDINMFRIFAKAQGGKLLYSGFAGIDNRVFFTDNENRYFKIPQKHVEIPEEELEWVRNYIKNTIENKPILWGTPEERDVKFKGIFIIKLIKRLFKKKTESTKTTMFIVKRFVSRVYHRFFTKFYYAKDTKEIFDKPFIYFPLHYPKDSQLTLRGLPFLNQADIVDIVSRYLPTGYNLVIKEHPHARGYSKRKDIKRISQLPRTKVVHPLLNSHDILKKASAIFVINSSVGFEAMLYDKPVIAIGRSFYRHHGLTIDVESLYQLEDAFFRMETFKIDKEQLYQFIYKIKKYSTNITYDDVFKGDANIAELYVNELILYFKSINESFQTQ